MSDALFSIILPTKNNIRTIGKCLDSIVGQTYKNIEVIFVDNFSFDGTWELANSYTDRLNIKTMQVGPERHAQRPAGFRATTGKYVYFIDSDMYMEADLITEAVNLLENDASLGGLFIPELNVDGTGFWTKVKAFERSFYGADEPGVSAARIFRREVYESVGGYDPKLIAAEDWDLSDRIKKSGIKLGNTKTKVWHDEGEIDLFALLKKKAYYAGKLPDYARAQGWGTLLSRIYFFRPTFYRGWREYLKHPILFLGLVFMLTAEMCVGGWGMITSLIRSKF